MEALAAYPIDGDLYRAAGLRASRAGLRWEPHSSAAPLAALALARRGGARLLFLGFKPLATHPDDRRYGRGVVCRLAGPLATRIGVCGRSGICSKTRFQAPCLQKFHNKSLISLRLVLVQSRRDKRAPRWKLMRKLLKK